MAVVTPHGHTLGLLFAPKDVRNWPYSFTPMAAPPQDIDWRDRMRPVGNQQNIGSCTGWGGTAAVEAARQDGLQRSPLYLYYYDRREDGTAPASDAGATMLGMCKALKDYGVPPDDAWPYLTSRFSQQPSAEADQAAAACRAAAYYQVQGQGLTLLQGLWAALQEGPCPIALNVYESFETAVGRNGKVPMPTSRERVLGGHCICACGWFNDQSAPGGYGYVVCQNSWGESMGDGGYYYLPAGYWLAGIVVEVWVVQVAAAPSPEPEPDVDVDALREELQQAVVEANAITGNLDTARYQLRESAPNDAWTFVGEGSRLQGSQRERLLRALDIIGPKVPDVPPDPGPEPPPAPRFVAPIPAGAIYGQTKWLGGSLGTDMFCARGTQVVAPADCIVEEVLGGQGISGGAELILALPDKSYAWRWRHVQAQGVRVGDQVRQGQVCAIVYDTSLDSLCAPPVQGYPDRWQHLDLSVNQGTDRFAPTGGGGGNISAAAWLQSIGYGGYVVQRTPGPPSCGFGIEDAIKMMTPAGRQ